MANIPLTHFLDHSASDLIEIFPSWIHFSRYRSRKAKRPWHYRLTLKDAPFLEKEKAFKISHEKRSLRDHEIINTLIRVANHILRQLDDLEDKKEGREDYGTHLRYFTDTFMPFLPPDIGQALEANLVDIEGKDSESSDSDSSSDEDYVFNGTSTDEIIFKGLKFSLRTLAEHIL